MKIARVFLKGKEYYVVVKGNDVFMTDIIRNDLGIESYFDTEILLGEKLCEINDEELQWLSPVARPGKIICIGRNYLAHAEEQGKEKESEPLLFSKYSSCLVGHQSQVQYPTHTQNLDYEVELAVIIGKKATKIRNNPISYIFGYSVANDLTARDVQKAEKQWTRGKAFDESLPIGPWIKTSDSVDPSNLEIWLTVDGEKRQHSNTNRLIFDIPYLIQYISDTITLFPGDIILTGTPAGVGYYMEPKGILKPGNIIQCGITNIGELRFSISE